MEIEIKKIPESEKEYIEIGCHKTDDNINEIVRFIKSRQGSVEAFLEKEQFQIPLTDIYYIESVDDKTFIYLKEDCFQAKKRLVEFENVLAGREFLRISKSVIVNIMKITAIKPALNGRFLCLLSNGEKVIISRKFVPDVKEKLKG
ncbi:MAG: LytTR family transcriptional regulator DNA-binding domain-containing protein [Lachnospiraceae bacterium]|nr:LytTR family transcriptional regulator DNA-binding domain-containing protein [Lachnospiraceae bacterium]